MQIETTETATITTEFSPRVLADLTAAAATTSKEFDVCTDCDPSDPCPDCDKPSSPDPILKDDYNFQIVLPGKEPQTDAETQDQKRARMIYIGLGLIAVFVILFLVMKLTQKGGA